MKASEIMINDLIYVYGQNGDILAEPHWYVRKVTADWLVAMDRSEANDKKLKDYGVVIPEQQSFIGDTKPIPITEEVLNANGWYNVGSYKCVYKKDGVPFCVAISDAYPQEKILLSARIDKPIIAMFYVHELQHALRLCGLNELADNLKIGGEE